VGRVAIILLSVDGVGMHKIMRQTGKSKTDKINAAVRGGHQALDSFHKALRSHLLIEAD
jgi:hypothetical protein